MATTSIGPIELQQINQDFYVGRGFLHTIQEAVDYAVHSGQPSLVIIPQGYYGPDQISEVLRGTDWIYVVDQRQYNPFYYYWNGTMYDGPAINLNGKLIEKNTIDLNGNNLYISGNGATYIGGNDADTATVISEGGSVSAPSVITDEITADVADFAECTVDNSPVRTFENSPDPGGWMIFPEAGIAVSTGEEWDNSIDPATLATTAQTAQIEAQLSQLETQLDNYLPLTGGTLTGALGFYNAAAPTGARRSTIVAETYRTAFYFNSDDGQTSTLWFGCNRDGTNPTDIALEGNTWTQGNAVVYGSIATTGTFWQNRGYDIIFTTNDPYSGYPGFQFNCIWNNANEHLYDIQFTNHVAFRFLDDTHNALDWLDVYRSGNVATGAYFSCPVSAPAKNFVIPHPLIPKKLLVHSAIEGPEMAVFYRGEGKTKKGAAEIQLPEYFEKLTRKEGRTVQVTPLFEDDNDTFAPVAASRVKNGKFRVISNGPNQAFYWEVKAIRADMPPLEVVIDPPPEEKRVATPKKPKR